MSDISQSNDAAAVETLLAGLNPDQRAAVESANGPLCIRAGAGSGKTRTITHRIAYQVAAGVAEPEQVLAVTFTDKAAGELRHRLHALGMRRPIRAATFHAAAWAQLRYFWHQLDRGPRPEVLTSKVSILLPQARRLRVEARDLASEIEWAKARGLRPEDYTGALDGRVPPVEPERMAQVYAGYEERKQASGHIDYDDMLLETTRMLDEHPDIAEAVRDRYRFFTVDEFQDVNPAQWSLLRAWLGESRELCVVGDEDQTIYGFTGASSDYLTGFRTHFPEARIVTLVDNYRSTAEVLAVANRVIAPSRRSAAQALRAQVSGGPAPEFHGYTDDDAERRAILKRIDALIAQGVPPGEIAICYRVNSQSEPFEEALRRAEIPYVVRGEGGFYDRREVRQALGLLQAAADRPPADSIPPVGGAQAASPPRVDRVVAKVLREGMSWSPKAEPEGEAARERWRNIGALVTLAERVADEEPATTLADLLVLISERAAAGHVTPDEGGAVTLLTLHKAKGLEFEAVFLASCEEGLMPISHAGDDPEAIAEERRLLYVGATRARRHLWISWATERPGWGGKPAKRRPSRFLAELDARAAPPARDDSMAERLRRWRRDRAQADSVPAYVVFSNATLDELAAVKPGTPAELRKIHGLGRTKVERYGEDILKVIGGSAG